MGAITLASILWRFWRLDSTPPGYHYDEAFLGGEAWNLLTQPGYHPVFFSGNFGNEPLYVYLVAAAFRLFGATPVVQRAVSALVGSLTVPAIFGLARELCFHDSRLPGSFPLLSAVSLSFLYWHLHFSRVGIHPVLLPLVLVLAFWTLFRALRTQEVLSLASAGVLLGLGSYAYLGGRLLLPSAAIWLVLVLSFGRGRWRVSWRSVLLVSLLAVVVSMPLMLYFWQHPEVLTLRTGQVAVFDARNLLANIGSVLGMFSIEGDANPRSNLPGRPVLDPFIAVPFYLGLMLALWRTFASSRIVDKPGTSTSLGPHDRRTGDEPTILGRRSPYSFVLVLGMLMLLPTALSNYAPHARRAIGASPMVALVIGLGLSWLLSLTQAWSLKARSPGRLPTRFIGVSLVAVSLIGSAIITAKDYFVHWGQSLDLYYAFDVGLWDIGQYVNETPDDEMVYISPRPSNDATLAFAWREGRQTGHFDGRVGVIAPAYAPSSGPPVQYVVILQEDFRSSMLLRELYPEIELAAEFRDWSGETYAEVLRLEEGGPPALAPQTSIGARWSELTLEGYDLRPSVYHAGDIVYLQLWWRCDKEVSGDWTVFTHVLGPPKQDGDQVWAGHDAKPGQGSIPTTTWNPGELILDEHQLHLPADIPPGDYVLEIGLYDNATLLRAPVLVPPGTAQPASPDQWQRSDHLILGTLHVE